MSDASRPHWDEASVGEYALGVMPLSERERFAADLERDRDLRLRLAAWDERFVPLGREIAPLAPPADLLARIEARLDGVARVQTRPSWRGLLHGWRGFGLAGAMAFAMIAALVIAPRFVAAPPQLIATLSTPDAALALEIRLDADDRTLSVTRVAGVPAPARDHQLWLIAGSNPPVSLGVLPDAGPVSFTIPDALRTALAGATLAISDEPDGGSPTGLPTGAVLAAAAVTGA
jgi:anti-sigma-K factor RskA